MASEPKWGNEKHSHCTVKKQFLILQWTPVNGVTLSQTIDRMSFGVHDENLELRGQEIDTQVHSC